MNEMESLLVACVRWERWPAARREQWHATLDEQAAGVLADWLEEAGKRDQAGQVRSIAGTDFMAGVDVGSLEERGDAATSGGRSCLGLWRLGGVGRWRFEIGEPESSDEGVHRPFMATLERFDLNHRRCVQVSLVLLGYRSSLAHSDGDFPVLWSQDAWDLDDAFQTVPQGRSRLLSCLRTAGPLLPTLKLMALCCALDCPPFRLLACCAAGMSPRA